MRNILFAAKSNIINLRLFIGEIMNLNNILLFNNLNQLNSDEKIQSKFC